MAIRTKDGPLRRLLRLIYDFSINHIIESPSRFWVESGYKNRNCVLSVIARLNRNGLLEKIPGDKTLYRLLYSFSEKGLTITARSNQAEIAIPERLADTEERPKIKVNPSDIPVFEKRVQDDSGPGTWMIKGKVTKTYLTILANFAEAGIIKSPARFWQDAGFQDRASAQGTTGYLARIGYLEKVRYQRGSYRLLYKVTSEGIVRLSASEIYSEESSLCTGGEEAEIIVLSLTLEEKDVFDMLGSPETVSTVKLYQDKPEELRINELKSPLNLLSADEKDRLIAKLCRCEILVFAGITNVNCGSEGGKSRIYKFNRQAYDVFSQKIVIMGELEELIEDYSDQLCRLKNSQIECYERQKAAKEEYSTVSEAEKELSKEMERLDILLKQHLMRKNELERQLGEFADELKETEQAEKIADLENTILVLQALIKLPKGRRVALAKKIFPKE